MHVLVSYHPLSKTRWQCNLELERKQVVELVLWAQATERG